MLANQITPLVQQDKHTLAENRFIKDIINRAANACNNINNQDFDVEKARKQSENDFVALNVEGCLQALVAAQMMAIHKLQQTSMALAKGLPYGESSQYYTNTSIKLSNTFIQQATLLAKLQGGVGQKITVERIDVSHGGASSYWHCKQRLIHPRGKNMKTTPCNGQKQYAFDNAPRCEAKTRRGTLCQSPAVRNRPRCRLHGCSKGSGAPKGNTYALTHGQTTTQIKAFRRMVREVIQDSRKLEQELS